MLVLCVCVCVCVCVRACVCVTHLQIDGDGPFLGLALLPGGGAWEMALSSLLLQQLQQKTSK